MCAGVRLAVAVWQQIKAQGGGYKFGGYYQTCGLIIWDVAAQGVMPNGFDGRLLIFLVYFESWERSLCFLGESCAKQMLALSSSWSIQVGVWSPCSRQRKLKRTWAKTSTAVLGEIPKLPEARVKFRKCLRVWEQRKACPCACVNISFYQCKGEYWSSIAKWWVCSKETKLGWKCLP